MKTAWRSKTNTRSALSLVGLCLLTLGCGCQSWSPSTWAVPAGSRVPPPATGSYQHQSAYYNNPSTGAAATAPAAALKSTSQNFPSTASTNANGVMQASATAPTSSAYGTAFSSRVTTAQADSGLSPMGSQDASGQVNTAGYTDNGTGMAQVVSASSLQGQHDDRGLQSGSIEIGTNTSNAGASELKWK